MPDTDPFAPHRVDALFLLVGGNPLPNAVAGYVLARPGATLVLVHTRETRAVTARLSTWFTRKLGDAITLTPVEVSDADAHGIYARLSDVAAELPRTARVGLHYTGGTKAMSVHAYRAVKDGHADARCSYLDARTLTLRFDPLEASLPGSQSSVYVGRRPQLLLEDLVRLHGWTFPKDLEPTEQPRLPRTVQALAALTQADHPQEDPLRPWRQWNGATWYQQWHKSKNEANAWKTGRDSESLLATTVPLPKRTALTGVAEALRDELGDAVTGDTFEMGAAADSAGFDTADAFCQWLHGSWLESLVLLRLRQIAGAIGLHDLRMGFHLHPTSRAAVLFEFDVVAIRGYQVFAFSCSTSDDKKELKHKLFELYVRARQFGGAEARMGLVCMYDDPKALEREVRRDLGSDRVRVFGKRALGDLGAHLGRWIKQQMGEA